MGLYKRQQLTYINVTSGQLKVKVGERNGNSIYDESDGITGVITGIRLKRSTYQNQPAVGKVQIRMRDPREANPQDFVVSGTVFNSDGRVTTWGRMIISRLINPGMTGPGDLIDLQVWPVEAGSKVTCGAVRVVGSAENIPMLEHDKDAPEFPLKVREWIDHLISVYGDFSSDADDVEWHEPDETPAGSIADELEPPAEPAQPNADPARSPGPGGITERLYGTPSTRAQVERTATTPSEEDDDLPF